MVGPGPVFAVFLLLGLIGVGILFDSRNGGYGLLGMLAGLFGFMSVMSAWFLTLVVQDFRDRHRYPNRKPLGLWTVLPPLVLLTSLFACGGLIQMMNSR